jgi:hypothetical protein
MKFTRCDNHSDREAVITIVVRTLPAGARPIILGLDIPRKYVDLCAECRDATGFLKKDEDAATS